MTTLMKCATIVIPAFFFSYVTDTVHMAILAVSAAIIATVQKKSVQVSLRSLIYTCVIGLTIVTIANTLFKVENRFFMTPSELAVPIALTFGMALLFFDDRPTFIASILLMAIFSIMMSGDINNSHVFKRLPLPSSMGRIATIKTVYLVTLFLLIIPFFYLMNRSHNRLKKINSPSMGLSSLKIIITLVCLGAIIILYMPIQRTVIPIGKKMEAQMSRLIKFKRKKSDKQFAFDDKSKIQEFHQDQASLNTVFIRVHSPRTPGYLRGRVYEKFERDTWISSKETETMNLLAEDHEYTHNTFSFQGLEQVDRQKLERLDIFYSGNFKTKHVLHCGKTRYLEMTCEGLNQTKSGDVSGKDADFSGGVTLYNDNGWSPEEGFPHSKLDETSRKKFLQMGRTMKKLILEHFTHIDIDKSSLDTMTEDLVAYFHNNFTYKLGARLDYSIKPIISFLQGGLDNAYEGHCELFATAATLYLRANDVPARYVTGFYCSEKHPERGYYIGRSRDLHAWVEYYDEKDQQWKLLEPTPPGGLPDSSSKFGFMEAFFDNLSERWNQIVSNVIRGYFAESIILFFLGLVDLFLWCFGSPAIGVPAIAIILWLYFRKKKNVKNSETDQDLIRLKRELNRMLKQIGKLKEISISPSMTLNEIAYCLEARQNEASRQYALCLRQYEAMRYSEKSRSREKMQEVTKQINLTLKTRLRNAD